MTDFKGPSNNQIIDYIKNKKRIEFHTVNNEILIGRIVWNDDELFHIQLENDKEITLYKNSIVYYSQI